MNKKMLIIVCLILLCSVVKPLKMSECITIDGKGSMDSITEIPSAKDTINATGYYQNYVREFNFDEETTSFNSNYTLINNMDAPSSYLIAMIDSNERLRHIAKISGISDIASKCSIRKGIKSESDSYDNNGIRELSTKFNIGGQGLLIEQVIDQKLNIYPTYLANTKAEGENISMISELSEDVLGLSEVEQSMAKLPSTDKKMKSVFNEPAKDTSEFVNLDKENLTEFGNPEVYSFTEGGYKGYNTNNFFFD